MSSFLVVSKFGGTSMANAEAMLKAAQITLHNSNNRLIVVSATSGTTNSLLDVYRTIISKDGKAAEPLISQIESKHLKIAQDLKANEKTTETLNKLFLELRTTAKLLGKAEKEQEESHLDLLLSLGERLSSVLFAQAVQNQGQSAEAFDVRQVLRTNSCFGKAEPLPETIETLCTKFLKPVLNNTIIITQGFIGSDAEGRTTTLGRGGSDFSAALLAEGLNANELHIWTDVNGIYTIDPNVVPTAQRIEKISFSEAAELANFGAKVLHPATLWPAIRKNVRVFIGSTFLPDGGGTWVYPELEKLPQVRAIAIRKNQTLITVSSLRMLNAHGFLAKLFSILAQNQISIDLVTTSEVSVALTVDGTSLSSSGKSILENRQLIQQLEEIAQVQIEENLSLVAVVGNRLTITPGISAKAFHSIGEFNVRLICHGASNHNLCFLVKSDEAAAIAQRLHHVFIDWVIAFPKTRGRVGAKL